MERVLRKINGLFATCDNSSLPLITENFHETILFIDEAGQATLVRATPARAEAQLGGLVFSPAIISKSRHTTWPAAGVRSRTMAIYRR